MDVQVRVDADGKTLMDLAIEISTSNENDQRWFNLLSDKNFDFA
jgi:hypothetical protein